MFFRMRQAAVLIATKAMDRGSRQTRKERTAVVEAIQYSNTWWSDLVM